MNTKYEYRVVTLGARISSRDAEKALNELGMDRWQLVSVQFDPAFIALFMMRPIVEEGGVVPA